MTRILIASLNYAPEATGIAPYSTGLAEHLASRGYRVTVVAGMPHYPSWRRAEAPEHEMLNGVDVRRIRHYVPKTQSPLRRGLYEASSLSMLLPALRLAPPDAVLGVVPSLSGGLIARTLSTRFRVPYGLIFQDLMAPAAEQSRIAGAGGVQMGVRVSEGWAARGATAIGVVSEGFRPYIESLGVEPARIRRVRNWSRALRPTTRRAEMRLLLGWRREAVVCLHAGNMGYKQGLEQVIDCARIAATSDPRLLFVLMGDGNQRDELAARAGRYNLTNLRMLPLQPDHVFASALHAADILLLVQRASVREMSLPSKLTSYFAAGRPVVAAVAPDSEAARELLDSSAGIVAAPDDADALLSAIRRVADDSGLAAYLGGRGQAWARDVLSKDTALRGYEQLVVSILAAGRRGRVVPKDEVLSPAGHQERRAA